MAANNGLSDDLLTLRKNKNDNYEVYYRIGNNGSSNNIVTVNESVKIGRDSLVSQKPETPGYLCFNYIEGVFGGYAENGNVNGNIVIVENDADFSAFYSKNKELTNETGEVIDIIEDTDSRVNPYIYGGYTKNGNATNNSVYIYDGIIGNVRGGSVEEGKAADNYVYIDGGNFNNGSTISGGSAVQNSTITNNVVEIRKGSFGTNNNIYGGSGNVGNLNVISGNVVKIYGGTFSGGEKDQGSTVIAGGYSIDGIVQDNKVEICGGNFTGRTDIFAGNAGRGVTINNTIVISGDVDLKYVNLYGRNTEIQEPEISSLIFNNAQVLKNNNLIIDGWGNNKEVNSLHYFDNIYFENIKTKNTTITIKNDEKYLTGDAENDATDISSSNIHLNSISQAVNVNVNDKLTITMSGLTAGKDIQEDKVSLGPDGIRQGVATSIIGNIKVTGSDTGANDIITVTVTDIRAQKQTAITTESQAAAAAFVNQGNELISDSLNVLHDGEYGINTFARVSGNNSKYDTGSYVDINGWNGIVGVANTKEVNAGKLIYGAFFENGSGNYNTYNDFNSMAFRGDGNVVYNGGGLAMRYDNADGVYTEASLRAGTAKNELSNALLDTHSNKHGYKTENAYYAAHIGIGKIIKLENDKTWDIYGKYFHTHHEGDSVSITNQIFDFDSVDSDKLRIGARFNEQQGEKLRSYYGLAWEYEFSGDVGGTAAGHAMYTPSLEGSTVIGEVGFRYTPGKESPWYFDANLKGYVGMQEGISGSVQAVYSF